MERQMSFDAAVLCWLEDVMRCDRLFEKNWKSSDRLKVVISSGGKAS